MTAGNKSHLSFLDELLEEEVTHKEHQRVEIALKVSGFPFIKSIDEFDFTFQPKLDRQKVMSLFDLIFVQQKGNVIFLHLIIRERLSTPSTKSSSP